MSKKTFIIKGWHVLAGIVGFFAVIIAVNMVFIVAATRTFPGMSVHSPYTQGIHYNDELAIRAAQKKLGWQVHYNATRDAKGRLVVIVKIMDKDGRPLSDMTVTGLLRRRGDSDVDRPLEFAAEDPGLYRARLDNAKPGRWFLFGKAQDAHGHAFEFRSEAWQR